MLDNRNWKLDFVSFCQVCKAKNNLIVYNINSMHIWDYDKKTLEKTEQGRILILERMINYGPEKGEKIKLLDVKKYWDKLELFPIRKRLLELLIWGKYLSLPRNKTSFWLK